MVILTVLLVLAVALTAGCTGAKSSSSRASLGSSTTFYPATGRRTGWASGATWGNLIRIIFCLVLLIAL
ncbi:MAG: hypothetical protein WC277_07720 [Bacilli bacterium]